MNEGLWTLLSQVFGNKYRDAFITRLGVTLLLGHFGITGQLANLLAFFLRRIIGFLMMQGIFHIDLTLDAYREGQKLKEFEEAARKAYEEASAKVYTEEEKIEIRKKYLRLVRLIGNVGNPKP